MHMYTIRTHTHAQFTDNSEVDKSLENIVIKQKNTIYA